MKNLKMTVSLLLITGLAGCSDDKEKGTRLGVPQIEPVVTRNTPAAMGNAGLVNDGTPLNKIKERFFSGGPTDIRQTLDMVDGFVANLEGTAESEPRKCVTSEPILVNPAGELPGNASFPLYLQCRSTFPSGESAIGIKDEVAYIYTKFIPEGGTEPFIILAKSNPSGENVEFWTIVAEANKQSVPYITLDSYNFVHGKADDSSNSLELTTGGKFPGLAVNCGTHMLSAGQLVYSTGTFAAFEYPQGEDCSNGPGKTQAETVCASTVDFSEKDLSECEDLSSLELTSLSFEGAETAGSYENAYKFRETDISEVMSVDIAQ